MMMMMAAAVVVLLVDVLGTQVELDIAFDRGLEPRRAQTLSNHQTKNPRACQNKGEVWRGAGKEGTRQCGGGGKERHTGRNKQV